MIGIVIVSHGNLGLELLRAAELIAGQQEQVVALGLQAGDAIEELPGRITAAVGNLGASDGVLVLVDLFGGSPGNAALRALAGTELECVAGANLPMLLEVLTNRDSGTAKDLAALAVRAGCDGVRDLGAAFRALMKK